MSRINIKVKQVKTANKDLVNLASRVDGVGNRISSIRHQVDGRIVSRRNIGRNLNEAAAKVREAEKKLKKIHQFVDVSMDLYVKADKKADRFKEPEKKSVWDKMKDMFGSANDVVSGFRKGVAEAVFSTVEGIWNAITHPIETAKGMVYAVSHPVETAKSIWKSISDSWKNDVINGDAKSRSQWFGRAIGEVALAIIGTKGVDKAVKVAKGAKVVEEAGGVRVVRPGTSGKVDGEGDIRNNGIDGVTNKSNEHSNGSVKNNLTRLEYLHNKYGGLSSEQLNARINLRGETVNELQKVKASGISKNKMGPALAGVYDKTTGKYYYSINDFDGLLPDFHPLIQSRYDSMPETVWDSYKFTKGAGSHAEVIALNKALKANPNANQENFIVNVIRTGQSKTKPAGIMFPRCPHCAYLTDGFEFITEVPKNVK